VFECIDIDHDPHIIKYNQSKIVLLDCIFNDLQYQTIPYSHLIEEAKYLGCPLKQKAYEFKDWDAFRQFYTELQEDDYQYNGEYVEGFVFVDANGFQTKCKTPYYNEWKKLRGVADQTLRRGYIIKTGMLTNALENLFYGFCKDLYNNYRDPETKTYPFKTDIISLRERFLATQYD
jgi:tRNA splicing ligase